MDKGKIKNIIIIVLAIVNVLLVTIVAVDRFESANMRRQANESAKQVLEDNGITLAENVELDKKLGPYCTMSRNASEEKKMVERLIGKSSFEDQGGNIYYYKGNDGQAKFRGSGNFEMMLETSVYPLGTDPIEVSERAAKKMGLSVDGARAEVPELDSASVTVLMPCTLNNETVYNCMVKFVFSNNRLMLIVGQRCFEDIKETDADGLIDMSTAIMKFLEISHEQGYICSCITDIDTGYLMNVTVSGDCEMTPVWRFTTDTGICIINGLTGEEENF